MKVPEHEKCSNHRGPGFVSDHLSMTNNHPPAFCEERYKTMHNCSGVESSPSKKDVKANIGLPCHDHAILTTGEASVLDNAEASTSRTRSLDIDCDQDTNIRWIKRLKISDSCNHSIGTKSLSLDEATSDKKANQLVSNGVRGQRANSKSVPISAGKELMVLNQKTNPLRTGNSFSNDDLDGRDGTKQLRSWIQRWQKNPATTHQKRWQKNPATTHQKQLPPLT
ncbi:hypothetical protein POM88_032371 [Heracleum sosnowskyi]|uniref:Uncharacterized protein n=1 Tax=Heracleum sosnowskyi TaxID=360622 RepID=A0AAD8I013_9APIA|nr:hypothetical protein POM88_032371 [Heracleum sosnowskyi]